MRACFEVAQILKDTTNTAPPQLLIISVAINVVAFWQSAGSLMLRRWKGILRAFSF
jgi:hypothetical protein